MIDGGSAAAMNEIINWLTAASERLKLGPRLSHDEKEDLSAKCLTAAKMLIRVRTELASVTAENIDLARHIENVSAERDRLLVDARLRAEERE